ncbi:capsid assembly scaffolding protein [Alteromonas phage vB_AcoS-R7M]|uniref:Capsid assembly scaffolding protein n=1 Tax=Alteromonas phage vB_AcoS-R7M TaxID=2729541 RepID=A0A6M3YNC6_9CAUD|nr:capsid assembly scaffolding protein [Alteromonas phage vB_AcoS-R7M]QJI53347.1 capsid assembly scaffolding protein [Alteromonas phage vB_AcoS-R7M]
MLNFKYANQSDIPSEFVSLYTEVNGEWVLTQVSGIKTTDDVERVQESLRKEREDHKATKRKLAGFNGLDPDEVHEKLDRFEELEASAGDKVDDDKLNQMVETRLRSRTAPLERKIKSLEDDLVSVRSENENYVQKDRRNTIQAEIRKAGKKAGIRDTALDDAFLYGDSIFEVNEAGNVVTRDQVGVTPGINPEVWFTEIKQARSHWWPESQGAGATGGRGGNAGASNPFSKEGWNLTEQGKLIKADRAKAEQMAASAGTKIGGKRPQ